MDLGIRLPIADGADSFSLQNKVSDSRYYNQEKVREFLAKRFCF